MKRPSIKSPCVADAHHSAGERIAEVTFPDGSGCLLSLTSYPSNVLDIYRVDPSITVRGSQLRASCLPEARREVFALLTHHLEHAYDQAVARHDDYLRAQLSQRADAWNRVCELRRLVLHAYPDLRGDAPAYLLEGTPDEVSDLHEKLSTKGTETP